MSFGFYKYVCLTHRTNGKLFRRNNTMNRSSKLPRCPVCGNLMRCIGSNQKVPPKDDDAGWNSLYSYSVEPQTEAQRKAATEQAQRESKAWYGRRLLDEIMRKINP